MVMPGSPAPLSRRNTDRRKGPLVESSGVIGEIPTSEINGSPSGIVDFDPIRVGAVFVLESGGVGGQKLGDGRCSLKSGDGDRKEEDDSVDGHTPRLSQNRKLETAKTGSFCLPGETERGGPFGQPL